MLDKAHYLLRPIILRRVKSEVEQKLPSKLETLILCPLADMQRKWTKALLLKDGNLLKSLLTDEERNDKEGRAMKVAMAGEKLKNLLGLLAQLRKAANHPFLFAGSRDDDEDDDDASTTGLI